MPVLSHTLRGEGMDASEDGTGRGTPIIMHTTGAGWWKDGAGTLRSNGAGPHEQLIAQTVTAEMYRSGGATAGNNGEPRNVIAVPILEAGARTGSSSTDPRAGMGIGTDGDPMFTIQAGKQHALAINMRGREGGAMPEPSEVASVRAASGGSSRSLVAIDPNQVTSAGNRSNPQPGDPCHTLPAAGNSPLITTARLRRLSPLETERLQGFPDHWTAIDYRRRRISPAMARYLIGHGLNAEFDARLRGSKTWRTRVANDTVRYRAVGNSMAVPVLAYLLTRIREVDRLMGGKR